ncbi:hypothetical protein J2752_001002 [Halarchaeum rubridurum]|uniref:Uncharacterized protein n=1 Tax=Halarchaeum rubridurum TaxID=489911 RepID=A0A830FTI2_9EURY|nr:hypothetical protein [Halarchaeum rubridurum]MBP1954121.1 hypothetical protein [Halarchaeum rubridurum]GGM57499.1 hypothetical protein GCM10009017_04590 [Halarchaeum rubridurum]
MASRRDDDVEEIARRAARAEVKRLAWKVGYFVLGIALVRVSIRGFAAATLAGDAWSWGVLALAVGVVLFCAGAYFLAATFDLDRTVLRWLRAWRT